MFSLKKEPHTAFSIHALRNVSYIKKENPQLSEKNIFRFLFIFCTNLESVSDSLRADDPSKGSVPQDEALGKVGFCL